MKITKFLSLLIAVILILGTCSICTVAQSDQSIRFDTLVNDQYYMYSELSINPNEALEIKIENVTVGYEAVEQSKISYQWEKSFKRNNGMPGIGMEVIAGATSSVYRTDVYDGTKIYRCTVTVEGIGSRNIEIWLKEDSLTVTAQSDKNLIFEEEGETYYISDLEVGEQVVLTINATSTIQGANITYSWDGGDAYILPDSNLEEWAPISNNTSTLIVTKREGQQNYSCCVSDGQVTKYLFFELYSTKTITHTIMANGEHPGTYAGTYIYVTKPGSSVKIDVPATSTNGDVKYTWYYDTEGYNTPARLDNTNNTITATKSAMTDENPYAWEVYRCYLEDGNERVRYWIMLFCLDPEKPLSEVEKIGEDTPDVAIKSENEDLANAVFDGNDLLALSSGAPMEITISTESKQTVSTEEKAAIEEKLAANSNVGMYLDINIYKGFEGIEADQVAELNKAIDLSVDLPENLINDQSGVNREYSVVRMHDGVAETIPCTYNETTKSLEFSSDKFSTYTIVYTDKSATANLLDLVHLKKYLVGEIDNIGIYADYNNDGVINSLDLTSLRKILWTSF